jgi:hypothetical protein
MCIWSFLKAIGVGDIFKVTVYFGISKRGIFVIPCHHNLKLSYDRDQSNFEYRNPVLDGATQAALVGENVGMRQV